MNQNFLNDEEVKRAKLCVANIKDKMLSVDNEINNTNKPCKSYLREKLDSITWDVNVLNKMIENNEEEEE